jgi:hypothetical protein
MKRPKIVLNKIPSKVAVILSSIIFLILLSIVYVYFWGSDISQIHIKTFPNEKLIYTDTNTIQTNLESVKGKPLYSISKPQIKGIALTKSEWIKKIYIEKVFPHTVNIWILEKEIDYCIKKADNIWLIHNSQTIDRQSSFVNCPIKITDKRQKSYSKDKQLIDPLLSDILIIEKALTTKPNVNEAFDNIEFILIDNNYITVKSNKKSLKIRTNTDYNEAFTYFNEALKLYPQYQEKQTFELYEDKLIVD